MSAELFQKTGPWSAKDNGSLGREWVFQEQLRYYVVHDTRSNSWFICDRFTDTPVPGTDSSSREYAIRCFYKGFGLPIPEGSTVGPAIARTAYSGETG